MDGIEIRSLRKGLGLTQEEFAHKLGVTFATVNRWENGKSKPSRLALKVLSDANHGEDAATRPAATKPTARKLAATKRTVRRPASKRKR